MKIKSRVCVIQREVRKILYINAYIWNLEKRYWWTYFAGQQRRPDIGNRLVGSVGEGEGEMNWKRSTETYILPYVKQPVGICYMMQGVPLGALWQPRGVGQGGWEAGSSGRGHKYTICIPYTYIYGSFMLFTFMHWRRKGQPTSVFLPGESQGRGSLVGCRLWGCTESDTTEAT